MVKFRQIRQIEKEYWFVPGVSDEEVYNGMFGTLASGKFTPADDGAYVVMQLEDGDDIGMEIYKIPAKTPLRLLDLSAMVGEELEVFGYPLEEGFKKGDKVGKFEITEVIGNNVGAVVKVTA